MVVNMAENWVAEILAFSSAVCKCYCSRSAPICSFNSALQVGIEGIADVLIKTVSYCAVSWLS